MIEQAIACSSSTIGVAKGIQRMKLLTATVISLSLLASVSIQANQAGAAEGSGVPQTAPMQDSQTINITRSGSVPSRKGPAENFTGSVRVDPLFQAKDAADTSGANVTFEQACSIGMAHPSAWSDPERDSGRRAGAGLGGADRGDPAFEMSSGFRPVRNTGTEPRQTLR